MDPTTLQTLINNLPTAINDFETEVATFKYYMYFTTAALLWLLIRDARR